MHPGCSVQFSHSCPTLCNPMVWSTPGFPVLHYLPGFAQTHVHWVDDAIQSSRPLLSCSPQSFPTSRSFPMSRLFTLGGQSYWSFSITPCKEYSGLISFRIEWFDLLAFQGILKSLLQHCSLKASVVWHSVFFMVQLSHPYMTTGKTVVLTIWAFVGKGGTHEIKHIFFQKVSTSLMTLSQSSRWRILVLF